MSFVQPYHLKCNSKTVTYYGTKIRSEAFPLPCNGLSPVTREPGSLLLLDLCSSQLRESPAGVHMVYSRVERNYTSKSFAAFREAFSDVYPDNEIPSERTIHRLVTKFRNTGSA
jgi:hypothetical protein